VLCGPKSTTTWPSGEASRSRAMVWAEATARARARQGAAIPHARGSGLPEVALATSSRACRLRRPRSRSVRTEANRCPVDVPLGACADSQPSSRERGKPGERRGWGDGLLGRCTAGLLDGRTSRYSFPPTFWMCNRLAGWRASCLLTGSTVQQRTFCPRHPGGDGAPAGWLSSADCRRVCAVRRTIRRPRSGRRRCVVLRTLPVRAGIQLAPSVPCPGGRARVPNRVGRRPDCG
jgi:hypothetical protein